MEPRENSHHSNKRNRSMSDTESQTSQFDSFHSPLRSESPFRSDDPDPPPDETPAKSKSIVAVDKYFSPVRSSIHKKNPENLNFKQPPGKAPEALPAPVVVFNRSVREEVAAGVTKVGGGGGGDGVYGRGLEDGVGGETRSRAAVTAILRRSSREMMVKKAELGFRVCEVILCLISFSVMASDKTQGWSGDSFDRYKEYSPVITTSPLPNPHPIKLPNSSNSAATPAALPPLSTPPMDHHYISTTIIKIQDHDTP
ncbi:hypothetical protein TEA_002379 [Camellia sinensis var. sinensis]|uniref:CASP-like protein n=1 Tax=Camellia sinensis var. sinensis TaxID=542762 RepID=A0A4S4ETC6_CAMSN|nr:hypothetical protein TEA_002379 [Camellia sinensis var. sinensis]